jgi:hypothetical protein
MPRSDFIIALGDRDRISGALHERTWGLVFPFIGLLANYFIFLSLRLRPQALPFTMTVLFFVAAFLTLAVVFWPYMIPYEITVGDAAAPEASLSFMFWGAGLFVLIYTATACWMFRRKVRSGYVDAHSSDSKMGHSSVKPEQQPVARSGNRVLHRIVTSKKSIRAYHDPAGGWGALKATSEALAEQGVAVRGAGTLLRMNQPGGRHNCRPGPTKAQPRACESFGFGIGNHLAERGKCFSDCLSPPGFFTVSPPPADCVFESAIATTWIGRSDPPRHRNWKPKP